MKILFLTRWFPPEGGIFIERHAKAVALLHDLIVLVIIPGDTNTRLKPVVEANESGFTVVRYFYIRSHFRVRCVAVMINAIRYQISALAGFRYVSEHYGPVDLIHAHILTRAAIPAFLLNLLTGKPYFISEHWTRYVPEVGSFTGFIRIFITRMIVRRAAAVTAVSGYLKTAMEDCGLRNKNFMVIPNVVDTDLFTRAAMRGSKPVKRILHVSNFNERSKNIHGILRVVKRLSERRKDFEVVFIGGREPSLGEAQKYAAGLGLDHPQVTFKGQIPVYELADAYRQSSFLLMFSNYETFSIVIPEALSAGIPVLATSAGAIPEYFDTNCVRLIPPGDEKSLMENLNFMLDNYETFNTNNSGDFIENRFGLGAVGRQLDDMYKEGL